MIQLMNGDCLELMNKIPDNSVNMILCDLPYGITKNEWDNVISMEKLWKQYNRVIKDNGAIVLFAQGKFYIELVNSNKKYFRYDLVWDKKLTSGFLNCNRQPLRRHEQIAVFYKKQPVYNPIFFEGQPLHGEGKNFKTAKRKNQNYGEFKNIEDCRVGSTEKYPTSIIEIQKKHSSKTIHPTEKTVELCEYLIKTYTNESNTVLDNCMGSGTTGVACLNTNRNFIGIELNSEYFRFAEKRIFNIKEKVERSSYEVDNRRIEKKI